MDGKNAMKILLVLPRHNRLPEFSLSLGYIAAAILEAYPDVQIDVLDINIATKNEAYAKLCDESYDVIGVSGLIAYISGIEEVLNYIKENNHRAKVILGGLALTSYPQFVINNFEADIYAIGEGEITVKELIGCLKNNKPYDDVKGIAYKNAEGKIIFTEPRELIKDINTIPFPAWHLFDMTKYRDIHLSWSFSVPVLSSRGCPARCNFCFRNFGGTFRVRTPDNILDEVAILIRNYNIGIIDFQDEYFFGTKKRIISFCEAILKRKMHFNWSCNFRVEMADKELFKLMKKAGCVQVSYGIESGSQKMLDLMNKKTTVEKNERALRIPRESGLYVGCNMIIGYPGETQETIKESEELLHRAKSHGSFHLIQAYPGTVLWDYAIKNGFIKDEIEYFRRTFDVSHLPVNYTDLPTDWLEKEAKRISSETHRLYDPLFGPTNTQKLFREFSIVLRLLKQGELRKIGVIVKRGLNRNPISARIFSLKYRES